MRTRIGRLQPEAEGAMDLNAGRGASVLDRYRLALLLLTLAVAPLTTFRLYAADEIQYFAYLRSLVFDRDLEFSDEYRWFVEHDPEEYARSGFTRTFLGPLTPAGRAPNNAPIGSAILWSPFYLVATAAETAFTAGSPDEPRGYSKIDIAAVCLASMLYGVLGLLLTQEICRRFVACEPAFWATMLVWTATNLPFYMYVTPPMSHTGSFFASALFLWWWLRREDAPFRLGLIGGLVASVRWQDLLFLATPVSAPVLAGRLRSVADVRRWILISVAVGVGALIAFAPQMIVWVRLNGSLTPFGVISLGDRFSLSAPYLLPLFFSSFHGLFVWSPILLPAFVGLVLLAMRDGRGRAIALGVGLQIYLLSGYIVAFGHSFGQRLFVSSLPAMAIGLAVVGDRLAPRLPRWAWVAGALLCVWWNASLMIQHGTGMIPRNQGVSLGTLVENQLVRVPRELPSAVGRYLFSRESLYKVDPLRRPRGEEP